MLPLLIVSIAVPGVRAQSTTIGVEPIDTIDPDLGPGLTFTVEIWIRDVEDLAGFDFFLGYDTSVLTATSITYGDIFGATYLLLISEIHDDEGYLVYSIIEALGEPTFDGDGRVAIIDFTVDSLGNSALDLYDTKLGDSAAPSNPILHEALDGFFSNEAFHDIAVANVTAYPTEVEAGEPVTINVTVTNEGNYSETAFTVTVYADITAYEPIYHPVTGMLEGFNVVVGDEITVGTQTVTDLAPGNTTTSTFTWNTTGVEAGNYTISARASTVPDETDTTDNLFVPPPLDVPPFSPTSVTVTAPPAHDIAITSVVPSPTEVTIGGNVTISVNVENEGDFDETFDVTVYYDDTPIETKTDISLEDGTSTTLTFTWDTTDVAEGTYTIKATASVVPNETETADNTRIDGTVRVKVRKAPPNILLYVAVAVVAMVIIAAVIYIVKIRK